MIPSGELSARIAIWRQQMADPSISREEKERIMMEAIPVMRAERVSASVASNTAKAKAVRKASKVVPDADDLLGELEGL